ncbi:metallophosphoesterase [Candidatus Desantisbacteria bacterium]|nr:metallophosphoesterase [Candidatus Desantisbacteria bacterium]
MIYKKRFFFMIVFFYVQIFIPQIKIVSAEDVSRFSFAVVADPRDRGDTWKNALIEIRDMKTNPDPKFNPVEFIIVAGDIDPLETRYNEFKDIFNNFKKIQLFPVIGNHEFEDNKKHYIYARDIIIPNIHGLVPRHDKSCDYYFDYKNVRIIAIDGYSELGKDGVINSRGVEWLEQIIKSTPSSVNHIFISYHSPVFPRFNHTDFESIKEREALWNMLVRYNDRVRAVFNGHTHFYYRMRILNPSGSSVNDQTSFPDEANGIFQVDAGAVGRGILSTIVKVQVDGSDLFFRVFQAENGTGKIFRLIDEWNFKSSDK